MKNKLYKAMAAVLAVGVCLMPSTMAQAAKQMKMHFCILFL